MIPNCVAIDTETTGLNPRTGDRMFAAAMAFPDGRRLVWREDFDKEFEDILLDESIDKVFHNANFDVRMLEFSGFKVRGKIWDTMIFGYLLDGRDSRGYLNLDAMSRKYLPAEFRKLTEEVNQWFIDNGHAKPTKTGWKIIYPPDGFRSLPDDILKRRVIGDADLTLRLFHRVFDTVRKEFSLLLDLEHSLLPVIKAMEDRGIAIDLPGAHQQRDDFGDAIEDCLEFCEGVVGRDFFNLNSPKDQMELLEIAGILQFIEERTPTGKHKMSAENLSKLHHPVAHMLQMGKSADKIRNNFLKHLITLNVNEVIHTSFNQFGARTGRMSSSKPNLQNLPIEGTHRLKGTKDEIQEMLDMTGRIHEAHVKQLYLCRPGFIHVHSDKIKAELAMFAHYSADEVIMKMIRDELDVHSEIARLIFGAKAADSKALRRRAKDMVFGVIYGAGYAKLATRTDGSIEDAKKMKASLLYMIPGLDTWLTSLERDIHRRGYILTDHGRRHYLHNNEGYKSVSGMCQGTVGDEIKGRMVAVHKGLMERGWGQMLLNMHDEVGAEVPIEHAEEAITLIYQIMQETLIEFRVPMAADISATCTTWGNLEDIEFQDGRPHIGGLRINQWLRERGKL